MTTGDSHQLNNSSPLPRRILLISVPRTASNLLVTVLNIPNQPQIQTNPKAGYFLFPAFLSAAQKGHLDKPADQWTEQEKADAQATYQNCFDGLEGTSDAADAVSKSMFAKEHACWMSNPAAFHKKLTGAHDEAFFNTFRVRIPQKYGSATYSPLNQTVFSDEYLRSWQMVFIIRHPALTVPSFWRAMRKLSEAEIIDQESVQSTTLRNMDMRWSRVLYDWCLEQGLNPPVLDAYDLINSPRAVIEFCEKAGLDPNVLMFEWGTRAQKDAKFDPASWASDGVKPADPGGKQVQTANIMFQTLANSHGMVKDTTPTEVDVEAEVVKWKVEFGDETAKVIEDAVWGSLSDYEYLKARRITGQVNHG